MGNCCESMQNLNITLDNNTSSQTEQNAIYTLIHEDREYGDKYYYYVNGPNLRKISFAKKLNKVTTLGNEFHNDNYNKENNFAIVCFKKEKETEPEKTIDNYLGHVICTRYNESTPLENIYNLGDNYALKKNKKFKLIELDHTQVKTLNNNKLYVNSLDTRIQRTDRIYKKIGSGLLNILKNRTIPIPNFYNYAFIYLGSIGTAYTFYIKELFRPIIYHGSRFKRCRNWRSQDQGFGY